MKKLFLLATAFCAFAITSSNVQADIVDINFDVTGVQSWDAFGDTSNDVFGVDLGAGFIDYHVIGIGWDVDLTAVGASWLSEAVVSFTDGGVNLTVGIGDDFPGSSSYSSGGVVDLIGLALDWNQASNLTTLEFFESFDDVANGIDGNWTGGDITIRVERTAAVPEPGSVAILGACLLVGVVARRRRV